MHSQPAFDFTTPIAPSGSPLARHASWLGAISGQERVGRQCLALLQLYRDEGPLTDREAAKRLGVERTTINARRGELVKRGWVVAVDLVETETGVKNTRWGLA